MPFSSPPLRLSFFAFITPLFLSLFRLIDYAALYYSDVSRQRHAYAASCADAVLAERLRFH
jgi:hypothetical protein